MKTNEKKRKEHQLNYNNVFVTNIDLKRENLVHGKPVKTAPLRAVLRVTSVV
jgi:hypothetical protein